MENKIRIALAGNPNCGKTTLFNALTGSNQYVGNWPGVTVEKKEGNLKKEFLDSQEKEVVVEDLPGIYSLSPYTLEEVVARNYLIDERPDVILNIIDATNLERNLYLTTQLQEVGVPVVVALNMMDLVEKNGDVILVDKLAEELGCPVFEISALKNKGLKNLILGAIGAASTKVIINHSFSGVTEHALAHIEEEILHDIEEEKQRWFAIKIFERDQKIIEKLGIPYEKLEHVDVDIRRAEEEADDDSEGILTSERYLIVGKIVRSCYKKKKKEKLSTSDKIDKVVTNRFLALPIFVLVMFLVYFIAVSTLGTYVTDFTNDGLFGDGWYLLGIGRSAYEADAGAYSDAKVAVSAFVGDFDPEDESFDKDAFLAQLTAYSASESQVEYTIVDEEDLTETTVIVYFSSLPEDAPEDAHELTYLQGVAYFATNGFDEPDNADYGVWVPGFQNIASTLLEKANAPVWLTSLIVDGIIGGLAAPIGFAPQMAIVFLFLSILEDCGYMARVAFIMDRIFRKFGLSGRSFIPFLISSGCGVPGIMATRTLENEKDRRMTMMTSTWIPCGAKLPVIACIGAFVCGGSAAWWVAPITYFIGIGSVVIACIILKKTKAFSGDPAPFVMELPTYHFPSPIGVLRHVWERVSAFLKKAGTILFACCVVMWFLSSFGFEGGHFGLVETESSLLYVIGNVLAIIFKPLGFGTAGAVAATLSGFVAKEGIVSTIAVLSGDGGLTLFFSSSSLVAFSFLIFNLLDSPCLAAISTMAKEQNSRKWFWFTLLFQNLFAYSITLMFYQIVGIFAGSVSFSIFTIIAFVLFLGLLFLLFRPNPYAKKIRKIKV